MCPPPVRALQVAKEGLALRVVDEQQVRSSEGGRKGGKEGRVGAATCLHDEDNRLSISLSRDGRLVCGGSGARKVLLICWYRVPAYVGIEDPVTTVLEANARLTRSSCSPTQVGRIFNSTDLQILFTLDSDPDEESAAPTTAAAAAPCTNSPATDTGSGTGTGTGSSCVNVADLKDGLLQGVLRQHAPHWVVRWHEHEPLLQEVDEKLSEEEQAAAWKEFAEAEDQEAAAEPPILLYGCLHLPGQYLLLPPVDGATFSSQSGHLNRAASAGHAGVGGRQAAGGAGGSGSPTSPRAGAGAKASTAAAAAAGGGGGASSNGGAKKATGQQAPPAAAGHAAQPPPPALSRPQ